MTDAVLTLLTNLRQDLAHINSLETLLPEISAQVQAHLPQVSAINFYRASRGGLTTWYTTLKPDEAHISLSKVPKYAQLLEVGGYENAFPLLVYALKVTEKPFGLLELILSDPIEDQQQSLLGLVVEQIALMLDNALMRELLHDQSTASLALNTCKTFEEIASVMAKTFAHTGQFFSVNLFEFDTEGDVLVARAVGTANPQKTYATNDIIQMEPPTLRQTYSILVEQGEMLVTDRETSPELDTDSRAFLKRFKIRSAYFIALRANQKVIGFLSLNDTQRPIVLSEAERMSYRSLVEQASAVIERYTLITQSTERLQLLQLLNEITNVANTQQDEISLLNYSARALQETIKVDHVGINIITDAGNMGRVVAEFPQYGHSGIMIPVDDAISTFMRQRGDVFVTQSVANSTKLNNTTRQSLRELGIYSMAVVPMFDLKRQLIGSISFNMMKEGSVISSDTVELARTIVSQLSLSVQKMRLYNQAQRQFTRIQKINAFGQSAQATQDLETIVGFALDYLPQVATYDYAAIYVYDRSLKSLGIIARAQHGDTSLFNTPLPVKSEFNSLLSQVWGDYEPIIVDDISQNSLWVHPLSKVYKSFAVLPLVSSGRGFGIIELAQEAPYGYGMSDIVILRQMANQIGVALDNADAFIRSRQITQTKSRANEITTRLQQQSDMESMLRVTVQEVGRALGAKRARIRLATSAND